MRVYQFRHIRADESVARKPSHVTVASRASLADPPATIALLRKGAVLAVVVAAALAAAAANFASTPSHAGVEVVVELPSPPLVDAVARARTTQSAQRASGRLDLSSAASRTALARIQRAQRALESRIHAAIPQARIVWRYQVVLNGLAVFLPADRIARLERIPGIAHVTKSVAYHRQLDVAPGLINATTLWGSDLASSGQGVKIAILDDGIEVDHPFVSPAGFTAPPGFPRGDTRFTSAKVIVARAFAPPSTTWKYASSPWDPENSEHGVHVSGIAAGNARTPATVEGLKRTLSGVAPGAYLGNYKVLTTPTPGFGLDGNSPEIAAGIEAAVKDGMDVINLSLGEPEIEPSRDLVVKALGGAARAGVVSVVAAGNDYDIVGDGSVDSPGNTPEAITVAAATKSGLIADFSSGGPTPVSLLLKPDVTAPGVNIFSSYPTREDSWSSLSGTSMATPVVAGAVALLRQRHPRWTVAQIKSALATTGRPVFATEARKQELTPLRQGGGLIDLTVADNPLLFAEPSSLGLGLLTPGSTVTRTITLSDAGSGAGTWIPRLALGETARGVKITLPPSFTVPGKLVVTVTVAPTARNAQASGFIRLVGAGGERRVALWLGVTRPLLGSEPNTPLTKPGVYSGTTRGKASLVSTYRYPDSGPALGIPTRLPGPEQVFRVRITRPVANFGVVVTSQAKGASIHPRVVVAGDENRLTGIAGLPVDLNPYRNQFGESTRAAGAVRPLPGTYDIVFDSLSRLKAGAFTFRYWIDDVTPPTVNLLTRTATAGSSVKVEISVTDAGSGVDPASLVVKLDDVENSSTYDETTGTATVYIGNLTPGTHTLSVSAADFQETKNMEDVPGVLPNTTTYSATLTAR